MNNSLWFLNSSRELATLEDHCNSVNYYDLKNLLYLLLITFKSLEILILTYFFLSMATQIGRIKTIKWTNVILKNKVWLDDCWLGIRKPLFWVYILITSAIAKVIVKLSVPLCTTTIICKILCIYKYYLFHLDCHYTPIKIIHQFILLPNSEF